MPDFKMKTVSTFNALHLGDNLIHLHFLRKMAAAYPDIRFVHGAPEEHLGQLSELIGFPNLELTSIAHTGQGAINAWRGAGGWYYQQPDQYDFLQIHLRWFRELAKLMGLESPITCARDMLFDYPALQRTEDRGQMTDQTSPAADILVINSAPMSGQAAGYDPLAFDKLIYSLRAMGHVVAHTAPSPSGNFCTLDRRLSVTGIGRISQTVKAIIGVPTGPVWPTFNIWNQESVRLRLWLLDHEQLWLSPSTVHANHLSLFPEILRDRGFL